MLSDVLLIVVKPSYKYVENRGKSLYRTIHERPEDANKTIIHKACLTNSPSKKASW